MSKAIYEDLYSQGVFDVRSENYLWLPEMEFLSHESSRKRKDIWSEYLNIDEYVPFAINGGGDFYAWNAGDSVIFVEHDSGNGRLYALSLMDAVFRHIVEIAAGMYADICSDEDKEAMDEDEAEYYTSESEVVELLNRCANCFRGRFTDEQNEYLSSLCVRGFSEDGILVDCYELKRIVFCMLNVSNDETVNLIKLS